MIRHESRSASFRRPFGAVETGGELYLAAVRPGAREMTLRLRKKGEEDSLLPMRAEEGEPGRFSVTLSLPEKGCILWYSFLSAGEETCSWQVTVYEPHSVPEWWKNAVVYQIFPDRFARETGWTPREPEARRGTHRFLLRDWDTPPFYPRAEDKSVSAWPFWGGTLRGIEEKLPYLQSLGVTVLYLNPIFEATSSHRYDTADYTRIDPLLGTEEDFSSLCKSAAEHGMRIVLDGVFNHTGADSVYFDKFGNYGTGEAYRSWFRFGEQYTHGYECWWDVPDLPNVEENDPSYREFLCGEDGVVRRWLRCGASGWRLDVVDELPDALVREIRSAMLAEKDDALLLGEVWEDATNKESYGELREYFLGRELDSTMHYPFRTAALDFLTGKCDAFEAWNALWEIQEHYPWENMLSVLNLIGSHDRERVLTVLGGDKRALRQLTVLQYAMPGVPCIYYGDEAGMTGGSDPYNRGSFPWGAEDAELQAHYRKLAELYREKPLLKNGACEILYSGADVLGVRRFAEGAETLALINRGDTDVSCCGVTVPAHGWIIQ